jgi:O-antigen/teichoic acid export membrane protein
LFLLATAEIPLWILPVDALLRAAGETRFLFGFNAARLLLTAALVVSGVALYGLGGAIAGGVLSEAISRGVLLARSRRFLDVRPAQVLEWRSAGRIALAAGLAGIPALLCKLCGLQGARYLTAGCTLYCATYLALWWLLVRRAASFSRPAGEQARAMAA